jgi:hypothetical protein
MLRPLNIAILVLGLWLGVKVGGLLHESRCREAGGEVDARGLCLGAAP